MAVTRVKNTRDGDTFIFEAHDNWADSWRHKYTPYLHENGKWRVRALDEIIDDEDDKLFAAEPYDIPGDRAPGDRAPGMQETPRADFDTKEAAIAAILSRTCNGKNGRVRPSRDETEYEREAEAEIARLVDKDD